MMKFHGIYPRIIEALTPLEKYKSPPRRRLAANQVGIQEHESIFECRLYLVLVGALAGFIVTRKTYSQA